MLRLLTALPGQPWFVVGQVSVWRGFLEEVQWPLFVGAVAGSIVFFLEVGSSSSKKVVDTDSPDREGSVGVSSTAD